MIENFGVIGPARRDRNAVDSRRSGSFAALWNFNTAVTCCGPGVICYYLA